MVEIKIVNENDINYLKIDLGMSYYLGIINSSLFPDELKNNYIDIITKSILYYKKESTEQPKIISKIEFNDLREINYYLISFELMNGFVCIQKLIKIEIRKYIKNMEHYINEQAEDIVLIKNSLNNINVEIDSNKNNSDKFNTYNNKFIEIEKEIKNLSDNVSLLLDKYQQLNNSITINQLLNSNAKLPMITNQSVVPQLTNTITIPANVQSSTPITNQLSQPINNIFSSSLNNQFSNVPINNQSQPLPINNQSLTTPLTIPLTNMFTVPSTSQFSFSKNVQLNKEQTIEKK